MKNWTMTSKIILAVGILATLAIGYFLFIKKGTLELKDKPNKPRKDKPVPSTDKSSFYTNPGYPNGNNWPAPKL